MTKKPYALIAMLLVTASMLFGESAKRGWIGQTLGGRSNTLKYDLSDSELYNGAHTEEETAFVMGFEGGQFFGASRKFGVTYDVDFLFSEEATLSIKGSDGSYSYFGLSENDPGCGLRIATYFTFQHYFIDKLSLDVGLGGFFYVNGYTSSDVEFTYTNLGASGKIAIAFQPVRHLALRAGVRIDVNTLTIFDYWKDTYEYSSGYYYSSSKSDSQDVDLDSGFVALTPFIGCAFAY